MTNPIENTQNQAIVTDPKTPESIIPAAGDTVIYTNDMNLPPRNVPFQLGAGYTVKNIFSSGVEVEGYDQMMFHFEYKKL